MEVAARAATADDLDDLDDLATAAIEELTQHRGGDLWRRQSARAIPPRAGLEADLAAPGTTVVVGTIDDVAVGYGALRVETLSDATTIGVITDLFTLPGAREVGVGEATMNALVDWARRQGCTGVDSVALPGDRHTKNFFESFGLVARAIVVHRRLDEP